MGSGRELRGGNDVQNGIVVLAQDAFDTLCGTKRRSASSSVTLLAPERIEQPASPLQCAHGTGWHVVLVPLEAFGDIDSRIEVFERLPAVGPSRYFGAPAVLERTLDLC